MTDYYDRNGKPLTVMRWGKLFGDIGYKMIATTEIGNVRVSTVWLGIDHNSGMNGPPLIFESMIFGGDMNEYCQRYSTEPQASDGHNQLVRMVQEDQANAKEFARIEQLEVDKAIRKIKSKYTLL